MMVLHIFENAFRFWVEGEPDVLMDLESFRAFMDHSCFADNLKKLLDYLGRSDVKIALCIDTGEDWLEVPNPEIKATDYEIEQYGVGVYMRVNVEEGDSRE